MKRPHKSLNAIINDPHYKLVYRNIPYVGNVLMLIYQNPKDIGRAYLDKLDTAIECKAKEVLDKLGLFIVEHRDNPFITMGNTMEECMNEMERMLTASRMNGSFDRKLREFCSMIIEITDGYFAE